MSSTDQTDDFLAALAAVMNKDAASEDRAVHRVAEILNEEEFAVHTVAQLQTLATTADRRDAFSFAFVTLAQLQVIVLNILAQIRIAALLAIFEATQGPSLPLSLAIITLALSLIPAVGSAFVARSLRRLGPRYSLSLDRFSPTSIDIRGPLLFVDVFIEAIGTLLKHPEWLPFIKAGVTACVLVWHTVELWSVRQGQREEVFAFGRNWSRQKWLSEDGDDEIRAKLRDLSSLRHAAATFYSTVRQDIVVAMPGNFAYALLAPTTTASALVFVPAAYCTAKAEQADGCDVFAWRVLAAAAAHGIPGSLPGPTSPASWTWVLKHITLRIWTEETVDELAVSFQAGCESLLSSVARGARAFFRQVQILSLFLRQRFGI